MSWAPGGGLRPRLALARSLLARDGITHNDHVFGIAQSGQFDETALLKALAQLPGGVTEIYLHPAAQGDGPITATMSGYRHADEDGPAVVTLAV